MSRGKQKIEAQRKNAEKNHKAKGSQFEARAVARTPAALYNWLLVAQLANAKQLTDHYASKHPREQPPAEPE